MVARRLTALLTLAALACTPAPWVRHPMPEPPDRSCRTGGGVGHDIYIWECIGGERVVISQYCGGFVGCSEPEREVAPCGERTPIEQRLADYLRDCRLPPESVRWPGSH